MDPRDPPPTLTSIDSYLLSLTGKAGRNRIADRLAARGLRLWHMAVLAALADFGPHAQRDLCARLGVDPSDMAKVIDQLADGGHIARTRDDADRRRVLIDLTGPGRELLAELTRAAADVDRQLLAGLTAAERTRLHALLLKVFTTVRSIPD
ncbi:MarR family winged helix-turn-helix transcriptional regulator [Catellatospora sp. KI3]|uniref:MarR family winged helix-turn-helix transcriptional regulator n=1 Tax=Catellatospora sp. KI3 TaxID=3041620 RepID=UPI002482D71A|nr:MarR family winged helix-turn-helix transcriptional regulator [Catellatospora sp. KI3]MDI1462583.1 MarR family winged helix-turn-helix transcriptional regulator [Catellatospora sp. KI3]